MNKSKSIRFLGTMVLLAAVAVGTAYAVDRHTREHGEMASYAMIKQEMRNTKIRLWGMLNCKLAGMNNGQACTLSITDTNTGKAFELENAGAAMRLFNEGTRDVVIIGRYSAENRIEVIKANPM